MHNGYSDRELAEVDQYFESRIPNLSSVSGLTGKDVRRLFVERSSLLIEPVVGRVSFAHRTFQEYLAAKAAVTAGDFGFLIKSSLDDQWQEAIILAAGEARPKERAQLLKGLINKAEKLKRPQNKRQVYLLTLACLETCIDLDPNTRKLVLEKTSTLFPPKDEDESKLIASAGEPAVDMLRIKSKLERMDAERCVQALAMIGSDSALDAISEYSNAGRFKNLRYEKYMENFDRTQYIQKVLRTLTSSWCKTQK